MNDQSNNKINEITNPLALKSIGWNPTRHKFVSPSVQGFTWSNDHLEAAECPVDKEHKPPEGNCSCGLYATYDLWLAKAYNIEESFLNVMLLVEASGKTCMHELGYRTEEMRIVAALLMNNRDNYPNIAAHQAADYFSVPILSVIAGVRVMNTMNAVILPYYQERKIHENYYRKESVNES